MRRRSISDEISGVRRLRVRTDEERSKALTLVQSIKGTLDVLLGEHSPSAAAAAAAAAAATDLAIE
jgi:hypothetical protein